MSKEIQLSYKQIKDLRDKEDLSWEKIAEQTGGNMQSVMACYEAEEDRVYRPRAVRVPGKRPGRPPKKNGNGGHKATNGNDKAKRSAGRPRKAHAPIVAPNPELQRFTDELVAELRARGIWLLEIDLRANYAHAKFEGEQSLSVRA